MAVPLSLEPPTNASPFLFRAREFRDYGVDVFVTSRRGGVSRAPYDSLNLATHVGDRDDDVAHNRRLVARAVGASELVIVRQVHGATVLADAAVRPSSEADALVSDEGSRALAVLVADCVPILLVDPATTRFALAHAGWRGLAAGVVAATLHWFEDSSRVRAFVGPSISGDAYQVGPEVATLFADVPDALRDDVDDRVRLDLRRITVERLTAGGLLEDHVFVSREVTDGAELFYSDRAQRPTGRFALIARRAP